MEQNHPSSRRLLLIGLGSAVALVAFVAVITFLLFGSSRRDETATNTTKSSASQVATKNEIDQNLNDLTATIKQAKTDQDAAKAALKDSAHQVKVGN